MYKADMHMYIASEYQYMTNLEVYIANVYIYNIFRDFLDLEKHFFILRLSINQYNVIWRNSAIFFSIH